MRKERKRYTAEEKVAILRQHLLDKVPVFDLCDGVAANGVLPLAKGILRKPSRHLPGQEPTEPSSGTTADRVSRKEDPDQGRSIGRTDGRARSLKKKSWGALAKVWVPHHVRDQVVDFVRRWVDKTEISVGRFIHWLGFQPASSTPGESAMVA